MKGRVGWVLVGFGVGVYKMERVLLKMGGGGGEIMSVDPSVWIVISLNASWRKYIRPSFRMFYPRRSISYKSCIGDL